MFDGFNPCSAYFHLIHTTFRAFLIAESALRSTPGAHVTQELWFSRACRNATDAAADSILLINSIFRKIDASKVSSPHANGIRCPIFQFIPC